MKLMIGLLALLVLGGTANAKVKLGSRHAQSLCPPQVNLQEVLKNSPGFKALAHSPDQAELTSVSIFEGDPKEKADLAPDDDRYHGHSSLWRFAAPGSGKPRDLRLVCTYGTSGYARTLDLPPTVKTCIVERSETRDDRVRSVKCR